MHWQQYLKISRQGAQKSPVKNRYAVLKKIRDLRNKNKTADKLLSSVSLPVFSRARLRYGVQRHREQFLHHWQRLRQRRASESDILLGCLVLLVSKIKYREGLARRLSGPRYRLYNDDKYSYQTVAVYAERGLWLALQARALELEVSLSYLADLAVRLYLRQVLARMEKMNLSAKDLLALARRPHGDWDEPRRTIGVEYLQKVIGTCSYQKRLLSVNYSNPTRGKPGSFTLRLDYSFGLKKPPGT